VVVAGISFHDEIAAHLTRVAGNVYAEGDQGEKRFTLWLNGLQAIRESPLFGFGPGSFSGKAAPFQSNEAHNSFIDWGMSTGAVGLTIYLGLLAWTARCALRSGEVIPVAMLISVVMVSVFGYVLRQPDFWMVLVLVLILSERSIQLRTSQARRILLEQDQDARRSTARFERSRFQ
jgi:O-antigen ligase